MSKRESLAIVGVMCAALLACGKGKSDGGGAESKTDEKPIVIKAADLHTEYKANEVAADEKYKGKKLRVGGIISSIDKDAFDNMIIHLDTGEAFSNVMATMEDSEKAAVMKLSKQQVVVVECKGGGFIIGSPVLNDCKIFSSGSSGAASAAPAVSAAVKKK